MGNETAVVMFRAYRHLLERGADIRIQHDDLELDVIRLEGDPLVVLVLGYFEDIDLVDGSASNILSSSSRSNYHIILNTIVFGLLGLVGLVVAMADDLENAFLLEGPLGQILHEGGVARGTRAIVKNEWVGS